jgi:hypothetical protein
MKPDNTSSGGATATTSSSGPTSSSPSDKPASSLSESEYLEQQAAAAKEAIAKTLADIKGRLGETVDVRLWARQHPWLTLASAAVAGFATASTLVPSKEQQALRKLASIEEALREPRHEEKHKESENGKSKDHGIVGTLIREAIAALRPLLVTFLSTSLNSRMPPSDGPQTDPSNFGPVPGDPSGQPGAGST